MSVRAEPWQKAEIAGPKKALLILKPEVVVAMIKRAQRPILIVSNIAQNAMDHGKLLDYLIRISKATGIPIVATAHIGKDFLNRNYQPAAFMSAMDIGARLQDPSWRGLDGLGPYDLALFIGLPYYMEFVLLSALKHFSTNLKTISLDRYYNPHATWSFPNLKLAAWEESFETILSKLEGK